MSNKAYRRNAGWVALYAGNASISGVVRELTTPVRRTVFLLHQRSLRLLRETRSASNGVYSFPNLAANTQYLVLSIDPNGTYNAVVADRVTT